MDIRQTYTKSPNDDFHHPVVLDKVLLSVIFAELFTMRYSGSAYRFRVCLSAIPMVLLLGWLTVCMPVVYRASALQSEIALPLSDENTGLTENMPAGTAEEKTVSGMNAFSEFLHHHDDEPGRFIFLSRFSKCQDAATYIAYHGEMLSPPPETV